MRAARQRDAFAAAGAGARAAGRRMRRRRQFERAAVGQRPAACGHPSVGPVGGQRQAASACGAQAIAPAADDAHRPTRSGSRVAARLQQVALRSAAMPSAGNGGRHAAAIQRRSTRARRVAIECAQCGDGEDRGIVGAHAASRARASSSASRSAASALSAAARAKAASACGQRSRNSGSTWWRRKLRSCSSAAFDGILDPRAARAPARRRRGAARGTSSNGRHSQPCAKRRHAPHRAEAIGAGGAQGTQQEGFGLVVAMVGEGEDFAGSPARRRTRRVVRRGPRLRGRGRHACRLARARPCQRHAQRFAGHGAMHRPCIGIRVQAVVDVDRAQAARAHDRHRRESMQQHDGIEPATQRDDDRAIAPGLGQTQGKFEGGRHRARRRQARSCSSRLARSIHARCSR